jgi:hypothetical protein
MRCGRSSTRCNTRTARDASGTCYRTTFRRPARCATTSTPGSATGSMRGSPRCCTEGRPHGGPFPGCARLAVGARGSRGAVVHHWPGRGQEDPGTAARAGRRRHRADHRGRGRRGVGARQRDRHRAAEQGRRDHRHHAYGAGGPGLQGQHGRPRPNTRNRRSDHRAQPGPHRVRPRAHPLARRADQRPEHAGQTPRARLRARRVQFGIQDLLGLGRTDTAPPGRHARWRDA